MNYCPLAPNFLYQSKFELLKVPKATMNKFGRATAGAECEIIFFNKCGF